MPDDQDPFDTIKAQLETESLVREVRGEPQASADLTDAELHKRFSYHPPQPGQPERYEEIRNNAFVLALLIRDSCPPSRERSTAITKLEEVVMWANKSIAEREP